MFEIRTKTPIMTNEIYHKAGMIYLYHYGHDYAWSDVGPTEYLRDLDTGHCWLLGACICKHWDDPNYVYDSQEFNPLNTLTMSSDTRNKLIQVMTNLMVDIGDLDDIYEKNNYQLNCQLYTFWWLLNKLWNDYGYLLLIPHDDLNNHDWNWQDFKQLVYMMNDHKVDLHAKQFKKEIMDEFINYLKLKLGDK